MNIETRFIRAIEWRRYWDLSGKSNDGSAWKAKNILKERSRQKAIEIFPEAALSRKKDHNRAEALLIAEFAKRTQNT